MRKFNKIPYPLIKFNEEKVTGDKKGELNKVKKNKKKENFKLILIY